MKQNNLFLRNNIPTKYLKNNSLKKLSKEYEKNFLEIKNDIKNSKKTLNILDSKFKFNFKTKDLEKFRKFRTIALIGMGGSILGSEAVYNYLEEKIKKKIYFFDNLDEKKILKFKKKENLAKVLFLIISKSGSTVETLINAFTLNIIKRNSKNVILI